MKDPLFLEDLRRKTKAQLLPVPPPPRQLVRKAEPSFLQTGLKRSAVVHGSFLVLVALQGLIGNFFESKEAREARLRMLEAKSAIRVDMVDLPSIKLSEMAKIDATEEPGVKKPEEAPAPPAPLKPSEKAMVDRTKEAPKEEKKSAKAKEKEKDNKKLSAADRLKALRDSMRADTRREELTRKLKGGKEGRPLLGGNIVSQGDSTTGDLATTSDAYLGKIKAHLRRHYDMPVWMTTGQLKARIVVKIAPDGRLLSQEFSKTSGNSEFDSYVKRAIIDSDPFPPPPEALQRYYMEQGVEWRFP